MNYKIYLDRYDINDATSFYIDIICAALKTIGRASVLVYELNLVEPSDIVIVVKVTSAFRVFVKNPKQKVIIWFQGIQPEEMLISSTPLIKKLFFYSVLRLLEKIAIKKAKLILFVSNAMRLHYKKQYSYRKDNFYIMPCFNMCLCENAFFNKDKYTTPSFVYAGSLDNWQCFKETLFTFKQIETLIPNATLTILTAQKDKASLICKEVGVQTIIKYVPKEELQNELAKYKYGFILRKDISVNNVATPTKINSYMSAGIIPIVSSALVDFIEHAPHLSYYIRLSNIEDYGGNANLISKFDQKSIDAKNVLADFKDFFSGYYNRELYIKSLSKCLMKYESFSFN